MNYLKVYTQIIERAKNRVLDSSVYVEIHHIIPKCLGGDNSPENLVTLTAREHFICHALLCYIFPDKDKLLFAFNMMRQVANDTHQRYVSSHKFESLRIAYSKAVSRHMKGRQHALGHTLTDEHKAIISEVMTGNQHALGNKHTPEMRANHVEILNNLFAAGGHASQRNEPKKLEWLRSIPNDHILTNEDSIYLGDKQTYRLCKTINNMLRVYNIPGIQVVKDGPGIYRISKTADFDPECKLPWQSAV
ncbi:putative HNH homing endonuclease [Ralstonia phage RP13]|nr:putative HNH homing endonuclease [Ralstonia phage RP13]